MFSTTYGECKAPPYKYMKDNRKIMNGVRVGKTVFTEGMEDELTDALSQTELDRLMDKGHLAGDWRTTSPANRKAQQSEAPPAEPKAKK